MTAAVGLPGDRAVGLPGDTVVGLPGDKVVELPGRTTLSPRAVRRIAAQAAREVDGIGPKVDADAEIRGDRASLAMRVRVDYPRPVTAVTDACRAHLIARTSELTGLVIAVVDLVVTELTVEKVVGGRIR